MPFWRRRPDPLADLGGGVWRRAHDRLRRAVDRYHQMIEAVDDGPVRDRLEADGARLAVALDEVLGVASRAQTRWPSAGLDIPPGASPAHRLLSQAGTSAAQAAEAAAMARVCSGAGDLGGAQARAAAATRAVDAVVAQVAAAAELSVLHE